MTRPTAPTGERTGLKRLIQHIIDLNYLSEVDKQIIIARIEIEPSEGEIMQARARAQIGKNVSA